MPRRVLLAVISALAVVFAMLTTSIASAASGCVVTTGSTGYTVTVCLTAPADGAALSGNATVTATATVSGGTSTLRISGVTFCLDAANCNSGGSAYVLKDFAADAGGVFTFTLDTTLYADRTATLYAYAEMNDGLVSQPVSQAVTFQNGQSAPAPMPTGFSSTPGTAPGPGGLVVAAVGDGADGRQSTNQVSDLIAGMNPNMFLYLGDVYEKGSPAEFENYYRKQFGRFDAITNPTIGNHEYSASTTGEGYFRYWKSPPDYYSFDAGGWHFVSLNSDDHFVRSVAGVRQTEPGTGGVRTMYDWLADDLDAHASACTIVYYHHPLWNQGEEGPSSRMSTIWSLLAQKNVSLVLNGHDHSYQRYPALDGEGNPSPGGVTEIISGGGGHGSQVVTPGTYPGADPVAYAAALGALRLTLKPDRADFVASGVSGTTLDSGTVPCQSAGGDTVPPSQPVLATPQASTTPTGTAVALSWTEATDDRGVAGYRVRRDGQVVSGDLSATTLTWTDTTALPSTQYRYTVEAFDAFGNETASAPRTVTTPASGQVVIQAPASKTQDTYASALSPTAKGSGTVMRVSQAASTSGEQISYLKFSVAGTSGVGKATLMLNAASTSSAATARVYGVPDTTWSESTLTWTQRPSIGAAAAAPPTPGLVAGQWKSWDVTDLVSGNGTVSFALQQTGTNATAMSFATKENATAGIAPKLVIDPPAAGTAPSVPTGLTANADNPTTVQLSWAQSTGSVDHYVVYRNGAELASAPPLASPAYADTSAEPGTAYSYTVAAVDAAGNSSAQSEAAHATTPEGDTTAPTVTEVSPADAATDVAPRTSVTATFDESLDADTVTGQNFTLEDAGGTAVPASVTYDDTSATATLNPDADLAQGVSYTATVAGGIGGVTDAAGNALAADKTWSFRTQAMPPPVASFTASATRGPAPLAVQFTDTSTGGATSWAWDFGDGDPSADPNPSHTYTSPGTYTVTLMAGNAGGASEPVTKTVVVTGVSAGASTTVGGANARVTVARPAGVATGDVLVVQVTTEQNTTMATVPTGWTAIPSTPLSVGTGSRLFAFYRAVPSAGFEPASYTWQQSTQQKWGAVMTAFRGVSTTAPLETATATQVSSAAVKTLTVPGVTTTGGGAMLIGALGLNTAGASATLSSGWTLAADSASTQRTVLAYRYAAAAGASGALTWTRAKVAPSGGWLLALHAAD
jgi:PKD repeat protein